MLDAVNGRAMRVKKTVRLVAPEGSGGYCAYDSNSGECFELNEVAHRVLVLLQSGVPAQGLVEALQAEYGDVATLVDDVAAFVDDLIAQGIVEIT